MMRFQYNSNCNYEEKIEIVSNEILKEYPTISKENAIKIAAIDSAIDDKYTNDDVFLRYYKILLVIGSADPNFNRVLYDLGEVYKNGINDEKLNELMMEIIKYQNKERIDFPVISELYN